MNIYVGNLPFQATEDEIRLAFAAFGQVTSVAIIKDQFTGKSRGFAFVEMANNTEAQAAIQSLNGKDMGGRPLKVNEARPREEGGRRGGFGGGGGGAGRPNSGGPRGGTGSRGSGTGDRRRSW
jgi:cold-inducible RNA-binding protein